MNKLAKKKNNERAREYILANPDCTYEDLVKSLNYPELSKPYFFTLRGNLRRAGKVGRQSGSRKGNPESGTTGHNGLPAPQGIQMEILDSLDASGFSDEVRAHYKTHVLPLLRRLVPGGRELQAVFSDNPALLEIRRPLSRAGSKP